MPTRKRGKEMILDKEVLNKLLRVKKKELIFTLPEIGLIKLFLPLHFSEYNEQGSYCSHHKKYSSLAKSIHNKCSIILNHKKEEKK